MSNILGVVAALYATALAVGVFALLWWDRRTTARKWDRVANELAQSRMQWNQPAKEKP